MTVLDIVKAKLDNPPPDDRLAVYIDEVGQAIKTFCNRDDIPDELRYVHANMAVDFIGLKQKKCSRCRTGCSIHQRRGRASHVYGS
ncbi:hypothetical protein [Anoxybacillus sp. KU2-6(11)]|uniref:hypothetical protein n=1 Tax=Anoxybacillus sp. KU2-6(11) TaxID=1535751 RepID=UPI000AF5809F|nr:hypothetical protein [Anoxybacillus sp. KU2-6(11)]